MTAFRLTIIIVIGLSILFGSHYILYFSAIRFFKVTGTSKKRILGVVLLFLSTSFILATFAAHLHENLITRAFYFLSGFWLGLVVNLLMATVASCLVILAARFFGHKPGTALIAGLLYCTAFIFSTYGVWNASNPQVREIQVGIKDLPGYWKGRSIVQLSDVHLGHVYKAAFLQKVVDKVNGLEPDIVVITGDLFDGLDGPLAELVDPLCCLHAPGGVYFVTGNHETYLGVEKVFPILKDVGVTMLNDKVVDIDGLQLIGISYPVRGEVKDVSRTIKSLGGFVPGKPSILLYHSPRAADEARVAGVNLQLSGHTHKGQIFPVCFISEQIFKRYYYGLHTTGDYSIYTTSGVGTWGPPMRSGNTPEIVYISLK